MSARELLEKVLNECATDGNLYHISPNLFGEIASYLKQPEPEPPQRKPLSDNDFLQWLLTHQNDTHALNFATVDVSPTGRKWKLPGWVKKLKAVIEEFYGINASVCTKQPQRKPLSDDELIEILKKISNPLLFARAIEKAHGIE